MASSGASIKDYELAEPTLSKLYTSKLRIGILAAIDKGLTSLADLARETKTDPPNIAAKLKELEALHLVEKSGRGYQLTKWGEAIKSKTDENVKMIASFEKFKDFWATRDLSEVPTELMTDIGVLLEGSDSIKNDELKIGAVHDRFCRYLRSIKKRFYGVSPIYHKEYTAAGLELVGGGIETKLIFTKDVLEGMLADLTEKQAALVAGCKNMELYMLDYRPKAAFTVSEDTLSLSFKSKLVEGEYMDIDLYNRTPEGVEWGMRLFEHYRKQAKPVRLEDYL